MKTTALKLAPDYYLDYIQLVADKPLMDILPTGGLDLFLKNIDELKTIGDKVYAQGKWTVKEMVQHFMDTERIFINRALRFVRKDNTTLPGYDHDAYVTVARVNDRTLEDLLEEYQAVRKASSLFFKHLTEEELLRTGNANGVEISVLSIGFVLIGHPTHHFNVIRERYMNL